MADIDEVKLARAIASAFGEELDRRGVGQSSSSGYYNRNRFRDEDDDDWSFNDGIPGTGRTSQKWNENINIVSKFAGALETAVNHIKNVDRELIHLADSWSKVDDAAAKYARSMGQSVEGMRKARERAIRDTVHGAIGLEFGLNPAELMEAQENYAKAVGRSVRLSREDHRSLAAVKSVFGQDSNELLSNFEKFGLSIDTAGSHLGKMYKEAGKAGISLDQYAKNVQQGLAMAQKYNFSNGLKGMEAMAKRAAQIRMDMSQVESFANNFDTIEKTIQNSARLQVLGGQFAGGADALGLLHASLSDMDELEKRMEQFTNGIGVFNRKTGEVDISDVDRLRLKEYANITGQDFQKVMEVTRRQALRGEIGAQIASSTHAAGLSKDMQEMIKNIGTFQDGKAGVSIAGEFKTIEELVDDDLEALKKEQYNDSDNIKDIAKNVRSLLELRKGVSAQYDAVKAFTVGSAVGNAMKGITGMFTKLGEVANSVLGLVVLGSSAMSVLSMLRGGRSIVRGGRYLKALRRGGVGQTGASSHAIGGLKDALGKFVGKETSNITASAFNKGGTAIYNEAGKRIYGAAAESRVKSVGLKAASKQAAKKAATKAAKEATEEVVKKTVAKEATKKAGSKLLTGVAKGGGVGIIGAVGNIATDILVDTGKMKKGGAAHTAMKIGSSALEGAGAGMMAGAVLGTTLGSVIPGFGNAVGAIVGATAGVVAGVAKMNKIKKELIVDNQLAELGIERKGKYRARQLKDIDKALQTGEISNKLRNKLLKEGDTDVLNQINKVKEQKGKEREEKREKRRERIKGVASFLGLGKDNEEVAKKVDRANFDIQNAYFSGNGLIKGRRNRNEIPLAQKKENIGGKLRASNVNMPSTPIALIKGKAEKGESKELTAFRKITGSFKNGGNNKNVKNTSNNGPIEVKINGTIKLETPNGNFDILSEIKNKPALLSKLTEEIVKSMNFRKNGAYVEDRVNGDNFV